MPVLGIVMVALAGCLAGSRSWSQPVEKPSKPAMQGLVSMGDISFHRHDGDVPSNSLDAIAHHPDVFDGVVVNIAWLQVEPTRGAFDLSSIDAALALVRTYNATHRRPLAVSLRIWGGANAPQWAKALPGGPVTIFRIFARQPRTPITVGPFWSGPYSEAWSQLQAALAGHYDDEPLIREITDTSCSSLSDEPFVLAADPESLTAIHDAGFNDAAFYRCLASSVSHYDGWRRTNIHFAVNPFRATDSGRPILKPHLTEEIATLARRRAGSRLVLANHALMVPEHPWLVPVVAMIASLGPPLAFQTESPGSPAGLNGAATIARARALGAGAVELWPNAAIGGFDGLPDRTLNDWSRHLAGDATAR